MQTVVRTAPISQGYWYDAERFGRLKELLNSGWEVVMCNPIGNDLKYILERKLEED